MSGRLDQSALDRIFVKARSRNAWRTEPLPDSVWIEIYDLLKVGPTSSNSSPARFVFVVTDEAKARLLPHLSEANAQKSEAAPAIVIVGHDLDFADRIPELFPHNPEAKEWFSDPDVRLDTAFRNGTLQGAYLILAARALGLDAGPMSGFDNAGVDREFFAGTSIKSNFLVSLGHGADTPFPRLPRLGFDQACRIL